VRGWLPIVAMLAACRSAEDRPVEAMPAPTTPAPPLELTSLERKLMRIELALARIDPSFHSLRIEWPGEAVDRWRWPSWITQAGQAETLDELLSAAGTSPPVPGLDAAVADYARQMTTDVQALEQLVTRWASVVEDHPSANRPTNEEVVPILTRFAAASRRVHGALRLARPGNRFVTGTKLALYRICTDALSTLAYLPPQTSVPDRSDPWEATSPSMELPLGDVSRRARACIRAAIDYLDQRALVAPTREDSLYVASLATDIGLYLLKDSDRLAQGRAHYSSASNISQVAAYFAEQFDPVGALPPGN